MNVPLMYEQNPAKKKRKKADFIIFPQDTVDISHLGHQPDD